MNGRYLIECTLVRRATPCIIQRKHAKGKIKSQKSAVIPARRAREQAEINMIGLIARGVTARTWFYIEINHSSSLVLSLSCCCSFALALALSLSLSAHFVDCSRRERGKATSIRLSQQKFGIYQNVSLTELPRGYHAAITLSWKRLWRAQSERATSGWVSKKK